MTEPSTPIPGQPVEPAQPSATPLPGESPIDAYVRENHLRYSEPAIRQALLAAGNQPAAIDAALARYRGDPGSIGAGRRSARILLVIYLGVFALLSVGMFANAARFAGNSYGSIGLAIAVWAVVVAAGYGLSMIWVASRRAGLIIGGLVVALVGLSMMGGSGIAGPAMLVVGVAMVVAAIAFGERIDRGLSTSAPVLLSVPLLILLALGGACVATGLPVPIN
jgi:hypothetical protein